MGDAKIKPVTDLEHRICLTDVIPLATPFAVNIDPCDKCNFQCKFCPTSDRTLMKNTPGRNHGVINMELYKKVIDDIASFDDKIKLLNLHKDGEPLLNKNISKMVSFAKQAQCAEKIVITTNASLLTRELSIELIEAGLDRLIISIEGINEHQYLRYSNYKIDYENFVDNIRFFYENRKQCQVYIKCVENILSKEQRNNFLSIFKNISDIIFIETAMEAWPEYKIIDYPILLKRRNKYGKPFEDNKQVCPLLFHTTIVNSNGTVSACCADWSRKLIIGDCTSQSLKDIWHGEKLRALQIQHLQMKRHTQQVCNQCNHLYNNLDNIDDAAGELLSKVSISQQVSEFEDVKL